MEGLSSARLTLLSDSETSTAFPLLFRSAINAAEYLVDREGAAHLVLAAALVAVVVLATEMDQDQEAGAAAAVLAEAVLLTVADAIS